MLPGCGRWRDSRRAGRLSEHNSGVRAYVGVTDGNWYRFLADRPGVTEVNFWQPSGAREFRVLAPGEPFFFKTHYPHNKLVGGGFFSDSARLRVSEAWEFFGEANGVASIEEMRARIGRYRRALINAGENPVIGCLFVRDVRFFPADAVADPPPQFARNPQASTNSGRTRAAVPGKDDEDRGLSPKAPSGSAIDEPTFRAQSLNFLFAQFKAPHD